MSDYDAIYAASACIEDDDTDLSTPILGDDGQSWEDLMEELKSLL